MGCVKDSVFVPLVLQDLPELRRRIIAAISEIKSDMMQRVWAEICYRLDVCLVKKGERVEHVGDIQEKLLRVSLPICR